MYLPNLIISPIKLERENWSGKAYFTWVMASYYPTLAQYYKLFLHPEETLRYESMKFEKRKSSFLLGRYAAKHVLSRYFGEPYLSAIAVLSGVFGQPVVHYHYSHSPILTISHTLHAACAIASPDIHPMGLDFESIDKTNVSAMRSQMTSDELSAMLGSVESEITGLAILWSAKEALSKILMCGLTCPFEILAINTICRNKEYYEGEYLNFKQYKFQSWVTKTTVFTVTFPRRTKIEIDMSIFLEQLNSFRMTSYGAS